MSQKIAPLCKYLMHYHSVAVASGVIRSKSSRMPVWILQLCPGAQPEPQCTSVLIPKLSEIQQPACVPNPVKSCHIIQLPCTRGSERPESGINPKKWAQLGVKMQTRIFIFPCAEDTRVSIHSPTELHSPSSPLYQSSSSELRVDEGWRRRGTERNLIIPWRRTKDFFPEINPGTLTFFLKNNTRLYGAKFPETESGFYYASVGWRNYSKNHWFLCSSIVCCRKM